MNIDDLQKTLKEYQDALQYNITEYEKRSILERIEIVKRQIRRLQDD